MNEQNGPVTTTITTLHHVRLVTMGAISRGEAKKWARKMNMGLKPFIHAFRQAGCLVYERTAPARLPETQMRIDREKAAKKMNKVRAKVARSRSGK